MLVYDLKTDPEIVNPLWDDCMSFIKESCVSDKLYENYLNIDLKRFLSMAVIVDKNKIISFGGAEINIDRWGENLSRVLSRFWISPENRHRLVRTNNPGVNFSPLILKKNLEALRKHPQIKAAMITREGDGRNSFSRIVDIANSAVKEPFVILDNKYNVCGNLNPVPESCKQMIAVKMLDDQMLIDKFLEDLESTSYFKRY